MKQRKVVPRGSNQSAGQANRAPVIEASGQTVADAALSAGVTGCNQPRSTCLRMAEEDLMRLPKSPYIYFRFMEKPAGEILMRSGARQGARAAMSATVRDVELFARGTLWPTYPERQKGECDHHSSNTWTGRPASGSVMLSYDGEVYSRWTRATDAELIEISRYASGLLARKIE